MRPLETAFQKPPHQCRSTSSRDRSQIDHDIRGKDARPAHCVRDEVIELVDKGIERVNQGSDAVDNECRRFHFGSGTQTQKTPKSTQHLLWGRRPPEVVSAENQCRTDIRNVRKR
jgi:hypothetical protein